MYSMGLTKTLSGISSSFDWSNRTVGVDCYLYNDAGHVDKKQSKSCYRSVVDQGKVFSLPVFLVCQNNPALLCNNILLLLRTVNKCSGELWSSDLLIGNGYRRFPKKLKECVWSLNQKIRVESCNIYAFCGCWSCWSVGTSAAAVATVTERRDEFVADGSNNGKGCGGHEYRGFRGRRAEVRIVVP